VLNTSCTEKKTVSRYPSIRAWGKIWINVLDKIKATLENYRPHIADTNQSTKKAAVAVILRPAPGETLDSTEILFIKRAERDGDPWSGHMAFPGGHMEPDDSDLKESAIRETKEETQADINIIQPYTLFSLTHISQLHYFYIAELTKPKFGPTPESSEVALFTEEEIPWDEIAFPTVYKTLKHFFEDSKTNTFEYKEEEIKLG